MVLSKKCALYLRVSTEEQNTEMQIRDLKANASQRGFEIVAQYEDKISGSSTKRTGLEQLMAAARAHEFDVVLVWRFDRFARSSRMLVEALSEFKRLQIDFISLSENIDTSSPLGEAIFTIIAAMAQLERDIIRERVRAGLRNARGKGKQLGRKPTIDGATVTALRNSGASLNQIAKELGVTKGAVSKTLSKIKNRAGFQDNSLGNQRPIHLTDDAYTLSGSEDLL